ncbi:MAG: hypothetical protein LC733_04430 [Actinobacteria bacterium]|nr:hypothetical protein [Actinomycetota bacterium]
MSERRSSRAATPEEDNYGKVRHDADVNVAGWTAMGILVLVYAWWAVTLPPFSGLATMAVVFPGAAGLVLASFGRPPRRRPDRVRGVASWGVLLAVAASWQLAAYVQQPRADYPTLSSLTNAVLEGQPMRAAAFALGTRQGRLWRPPLPTINR